VAAEREPLAGVQLPARLSKLRLCLGEQQPPRARPAPGAATCAAGASSIVLALMSCSVSLPACAVLGAPVAVSGEVLVVASLPDDAPEHGGSACRSGAWRGALGRVHWRFDRSSVNVLISAFRCLATRRGLG